ncbi:MAG: nucleoside deaminase, partial [Fuerstiella sp.]
SSHFQLQLTMDSPMPELAERFELSLPAGWQQQLPESTLTSDVDKMTFVLQLARWNIANKSGGPFAAAVFERETNRLIAVGVNRVVPQHCSLAHAEAMAIALAQQSLHTHDLSTASKHGFELFASGQPCVQCFGMTWWSGLTRLIVGARSEDIEQLTQFCEGPLPDGWQQLLANRTPLPPVEVQMDICREHAREVLISYAQSDGPNYSPGRS